MKQVRFSQFPAGVKGTAGKGKTLNDSVLLSKSTNHVRYFKRTELPFVAWVHTPPPPRKLRTAAPPYARRGAYRGVIWRTGGVCRTGAARMKETRVGCCSRAGGMHPLTQMFFSLSLVW